ncbi:hypothetical protein LIER_42242 [Lithospermum erythrorhizon]|uniref:Uncharacterized protein n=1 Tax=Lithospermum erythrorhizon TaxID=34254 RepID=A0AAV3RN91_LITER
MAESMGDHRPKGGLTYNITPPSPPRLYGKLDGESVTLMQKNTNDPNFGWTRPGRVVTSNTYIKGAFSSFERGNSFTKRKKERARLRDNFSRYNNSLGIQASLPTFKSSSDKSKNFQKGSNLQASVSRTSKPSNLQVQVQEFQARFKS